MSSTAPAPIGAVAHYNLLERLEPAGPGDLYRARDTRLGRTVAIRLLPVDFAREPAARADLLEKARVLFGMSHPNITTIFDASSRKFLRRTLRTYKTARQGSLLGSYPKRPIDSW